MWNAFAAGLFLLVTATTSLAGTITGAVVFQGEPKPGATVQLVDVKADGAVPKNSIVLIQKDQVFLPAVLAVVRGATVAFLNKDTVFHNVFSLSEDNAFDFGKFGFGKSPEKRFDHPGVVDVFCNMHAQMRATIVVLDHPYFALTEKNGRFTIENIPDGNYRIKAWATPTVFNETSVVVPKDGSTDVTFDLRK